MHQSIQFQSGCGVMVACRERLALAKGGVGKESIGGHAGHVRTGSHRRGKAVCTETLLFHAKLDGVRVRIIGRDG
jgi:hypothetical protein